MLFSCFVFSLMGAIAKHLSKTISPIELVFFRNLFGLIVISYSFYKNPPQDKGGHPWILVFRGVMGTIGLYAVFYNLANTTLGETITYIQSSPIFVALFASIFLKEYLSPMGWVAILVGFSGISLLFNFEESLFKGVNLMGIITAITVALAYTSIRYLKSFYDTRTIVFTFGIIGVVVPIFSIWGGTVWDVEKYSYVLCKFVWPNVMEWVSIFFLGLTALVGQIYLTKAYGETKAGIVSTVGYAQILMSTIIGLMMGDRLFSFMDAMGTGLIILGGFLITQTNRK